MNLKNKMILLLLISFAVLLLVPSMVNAATVQYTRTIPSNDGTIVINFTGLELDPTKAYEFALVRQGGTPQTWFSIDDGYTETTATVTLSSTKSAIVDILKVTDTGFIYIREKDDTTGSYVLQAKQVDLTLPKLQSISYTKNDSEYNLLGMLYGSIGNNYVYTGADQTYIAWEKVTDEDFVEDFLDIKNNQGKLTDLETKLGNPPSANYFSASRQPGYSDKNDGLYLLWVKRTGTKTVVSCIIHDGLPEATTVEQYIQSADLEAPKMETLEIENTSSLKYNSETGYYFVDSGKTITIKATFSETIYGNIAPTLKIKCGNGEEITVPEGTITGQYILWNYTIKEQDKGIIAVVSMTGGDVADEEGNAVTEYTCPVLVEEIWESLVYANGSGIVSAPEDNDGETPEDEDKETNDDKKEDVTGTDDKKDNTTADKELPKTGKMTLVSILIVTIIAGTTSFIKTKKYKGI